MPQRPVRVLDDPNVGDKSERVVFQDRSVGRQVRDYQVGELDHLVESPIAFFGTVAMVGICSVGDGHRYDMEGRNRKNASDSYVDALE